MVTSLLFINNYSIYFQEKFGEREVITTSIQKTLNVVTFLNSRKSYSIFPLH